jgi:hypothetical protein
VVCRSVRAVTAVEPRALCPLADQTTLARGETDRSRLPPVAVCLVVPADDDTVHL